MELNSVDAQLLDLIADDFYGLWEVADYFAQLRPEIGRQASNELIRARMRDYVQAGYVNIFIGSLSTEKDFQRVVEELSVLDDPKSWQRPTAFTDNRVAVSAASKAEGPVSRAWPK